MDRRTPAAWLRIELEDEDGAAVCRLGGELDADGAARLRALLGERVDTDRDLTIDVADLQFIDSRGLGVLVGTLKRFEAAGRRLTLRSPTPALCRVLEMTALADAFPIER